MTILNHKNTRPRQKTILIFGVSSFVGSNLAELFKHDYRVIGTYYKTKMTVSGILTLPCDVLSKDDVSLVVYAMKPDITVYCVGMTGILACSINESLADALNTVGLTNVAEASERYKSQICYLSSNFVFQGEDRKYIEMDIPDSLTAYGKGQAVSEFYIQKTSLNYLIFRCSKLYGRSYSPIRHNFFEYIQKKFFNKETMALDDTIHMGFLDVSYLAMVMKIAFAKQITNRLFQVSTNDICTHYDFAKTYAQVFNSDGDLVSKEKWPVPLHSSEILGVHKKMEDYHFKLDIANVEGFLNIKLPSIRESLELTWERYSGQLLG